MRMHIPKILSVVTLSLLLGACIESLAGQIPTEDGTGVVVLDDGTRVASTFATHGQRDGSNFDTITTFKQLPRCINPDDYLEGVCGGSYVAVDTVGADDRGVPRELLGHAVHLGSYLGGAAIVGGAGDVVNSVSATAGAFAKHGGKGGHGGHGGPPGPTGPGGPPGLGGPPNGHPVHPIHPHGGPPGQTGNPPGIPNPPGHN